MNTKSQLVVQCYQLVFLLKLLLKKQENKLWNKKNINYTIIYGRKNKNIWQKKQKYMAEKTKSKNHVLKSNNKVLAFNIKLNLQQQLRF